MRRRSESSARGGIREMGRILLRHIVSVAAFQSPVDARLTLPSSMESAHRDDRGTRARARTRPCRRHCDCFIRGKFPSLNLDETSVEIIETKGRLSGRLSAASASRPNCAESLLRCVQLFAPSTEAQRLLVAELFVDGSRRRFAQECRVEARMAGTHVGMGER